MSRALGRGGIARSGSLEWFKQLIFQLRIVYAQNKAIFTARFNSLGRTWSGETGQGRAWWDDEKAARNLARHGVSFEAARLAIGASLVAATHPHISFVPYPGMPATVMFPTIERTALDYLVGPLTRARQR